MAETCQFQPNLEPTTSKNKYHEAQKIRILTLRWVPNLGVRRTLAGHLVRRGLFDAAIAEDKDNWTQGEADQSVVTKAE